MKPGKEARNVEGILEVVRSGLCHGCAACVGICPAGTLKIGEEGYPRQVADCIQCNRCMQVCSGYRVNFTTLGRAVFGDDYTYGAWLGHVLESRIAHAADPRVRLSGASGGAVSALLLHLLQSNEVDAVVVSEPEPSNLCLTRGYIAHTPEEVRQRAGSHYARASTLGVLAELRDEKLRLAVVGLPCHIHALRMAQQKKPPQWRNIRITIGLYCHFALPPSAPRELMELTARGKQAISIVYRDKSSAGWPCDGPRIDFADGSRWMCEYLPSEMMTLLGHLYPLGRCLMCTDATAELADLSAGDPWIRAPDGSWRYGDPEGNSVILVRTEAGRRCLEQAEDAGVIRTRPIDPQEVLAGQRAMISEKKIDVPARIRLRSLLGQAVPHYLPQLPRPNFLAVLRQAAYLGLTAPIRHTALRRLLLRLCLSRMAAALMRRHREWKRKRWARRHARHHAGSE